MNKLTIKELKTLAAKKGITVTGDKRKKQTYLDALVQSEIVTPVTTSTVTPWLAENIKTRQAALLERRSLVELKAIAKKRGIIPTGNTRKKSTWANALAEFSLRF